MNEQLTGAVEAALTRAGVLRRGATLLVALSGGADSVALLRTVYALGNTHGFTVRAAHVEHGLRGEASREDARFCEQLCADLGVPFTCDSAALTGDMHTPGVEERARKARYALLISRAKACGADALLTAHHRDDQAETVLAHLLRGSGARGLSGMREATVVDGVPLVRPFLTVSRQDIEQAMAGMPYREDASNDEPCCQRNRLRADVLPLLQRENPRAAEHMAQSATLLAMDEDCLTRQANTLVQNALIDRPPFFCLPRTPLLAAPDAIALRALRRFVRLGAQRCAAQAERPAPQEETASATVSLALLSLLHVPPGGTMNLPFGLKAQATQRYIHLVRMETDAPLVPAAPITPATGFAGRRSLRFGELTFRFTPFASSGSPPDGLISVAVPAAILPRLTLRTARAGDRIHPFGAAGSKELRRYFTDHKVDVPFRTRIPLLCLDREVFWAVGTGAAESTQLTGEPAVRIAVSGAMPWYLPLSNPKRTTETQRSGRT